MIPKKLLKKKILEALQMAEGYGKTEGMIRDLVAELTSEVPATQDLRDELEPLLSERMVRSERDAYADVLWYITPRGSAKLNTL